VKAYRNLQAENRRLEKALAVAERGIEELRCYALSDKYSRYPDDPGIAPADVVQRCLSAGFAISEALCAAESDGGA